ncbi:uncharacterized protein LOC128503629 isoform X2 [Spea bombifrons]|uniref:uncharacterized protein LOC128503629 isoform X2 n=1 Tax=Spea bombifrons TaxID=233779 RepID=UPI00234B07C2|nr:uncharacterized protein LOC128503629 isoform X2 [Spea bombifrons]
MDLWKSEDQAMIRMKMAYHLQLCFYTLHFYLTLEKVWGVDFHTLIDPGQDCTGQPTLSPNHVDDDGPSLTSVNLRSILKWKSEERTHWIPLHVPTTCVRGCCSADLSGYIKDIYVHYQAKVRCPRGNLESQWNTSCRMQLYKDARVGPPLLNISLGQSQLDIVVKLPPSPWFTQNGSQLPIQRYISKLGHLIISVEIGSQLWNTINTDFVESTRYRCLVSVPHILGAVYCVTVSSKSNNGIVEKKCEKAPNGEKFISLHTAVTVLVGIMFIVCLGLLIWRCQCLRTTISQPKVLDFPVHPHPAVFVTEELNLHPALSLVHLEKTVSPTKVRKLMSRNEYLENGFIVKLGPNQEGWKNGDWDLTEDSSAYSQEIMTNSATENPPLYCGIPDYWENSTNINLNYLQVMEAWWDLSINEARGETDNDILDVCNGSKECSADEREKEDNVHLKTNGYKRRSLVLV